MNMYNESMINDYIEGTISPENEDILFNELAYDKKLRQDLRTFMDMEHIPVALSDRFVIPAAVTDNIFSKLNFPADTQFKHENIKKSFFLKYRQGIICSTATVLFLTAFYFLFLNKEPQEYLASEVKNNIVKPNNPIDIFKQFGYGIESNANQKNIERKIKPQIVYKNNTNSDFVVNSLSSNKENNLVSDIQLADISENVFKEPIELDNMGINDKINNQFYFNNENISDEKESSENKIYQILSNFSFRLAGFRKIKIEDELIENSKDEFLKNASFTLLYKLSDKCEIGLDFRNESNYLHYIAKVNDVKYDMYQNTNFFSYGILFNYQLFDYYGFNPYTEVYLGANKIGCNFRVGLGLEYKYSPAYSLILGSEYGALIYNQNSQLFASNKLGIFYGIKLRL